MRSCLDPVLSSIRVRNAQGITITNCDVTTWSWVNLVNPSYLGVLTPFCCLDLQSKLARRFLQDK